MSKLNFLIYKDRAPAEIGGSLHALQLTNKVDAVGSVSRGQNGFVFVTPAWMISEIDPETGFINRLYPRYENMEQAQD